MHEFVRADGRNCLVPNETSAGVTGPPDAHKPPWVLVCSYPLRREGTKINQRLFSFFSKSSFPFGGVVRPRKGHSIFVFL